MCRKKTDRVDRRIKDFRPINLISSVYKILANRLSKVLASTITFDQTAFVKGRQILDAALVANEVMKDVRSHKRKGIIFKLDFGMAYDRVS